MSRHNVVTDQIEAAAVDMRDRRLMKKFDPSRHFQISERPLDANGRALAPLDLVIIKRIPEHYFCDEGFETLQEYVGHYGLVTYAALGGQVTPFYAGDRSHPGWVSGDLKHAHVLSRNSRDGAIRSWDFWIPTVDLVRIPYNVLVMNIFADYPWQMADEEGPSDHHFVVSGMQQFEHIELVMRTPYETLVAAHNAAMATLADPG